MLDVFSTFDGIIFVVFILVLVILRKTLEKKETLMNAVREACLGLFIWAFFVLLSSSIFTDFKIGTIHTWTALGIPLIIYIINFVWIYFDDLKDFFV